MKAILDLSRRQVGWKSGDVLYNAHGDVCAFVRGTEVFTFRQRHIGLYDGGLFRNAAGAVVGTVTPSPTTTRRRRRRYQITPWLRFSLPAPKPKTAFRTWAIWDNALDTFSQ